MPLSTLGGLSRRDRDSTAQETKYVRLDKRKVVVLLTTGSILSDFMAALVRLNLEPTVEPLLDPPPHQIVTVRRSI